MRQGRIQNFSFEGAPMPRRGRYLPNIIVIFSGKPYEIKEILVCRGPCQVHPPLNLPLWGLLLLQWTVFRQLVDMPLWGENCVLATEAHGCDNKIRIFGKAHFKFGHDIGHIKYSTTFELIFLHEGIQISVWQFDCCQHMYRDYCIRISLLYYSNFMICYCKVGTFFGWKHSTDVFITR